MVITSKGSRLTVRGLVTLHKGYPDGDIQNTDYDPFPFTTWFDAEPLLLVAWWTHGHVDP